MRRIQLDDLAKQLGFSKTLISMVLNGKGNHYGISQSTQAIVLDAVAKLNYVPNKFAKSLRTGKSHFVGLIVSDIANPFYSTIAKNVESVLSAHGYNLMVCSTEENEEKEKQLVEMMIYQQGVDGLIIASSFKEAGFYNQPHLTRVPLVFIDRVLPLFAANYVVIDNFGGSADVVNKLLEQGARRIACFAITPLHLSTIDDRLNGYKSALSAKGISKTDKLVKAIQYDRIQEDIERSLVELRTLKQPVDAIFVLNNNIAVALLGTIRKKEFEDFADVRIACFDDIALFNIMDKKVISVSQPVEEIGRNSSNVLLEVINGNQNSKTTTVLSTTTITR